MIPKVTQEAPNIIPRYWCAKCGRSLPRGNSRKECWSFCPTCGEPIEWDAAKMVEWKEKECKTCAAKLIRDTRLGLVVTGQFNGTDYCDECMKAFCRDTDCRGCERGTYPKCKFGYLKQREAPEE